MNFFFKIKKIENLLLKRENIFFSLLILLIFACDRFTKEKIINSFNERSYFINDFLNVELIWNIGIGFGFLSTDSTFFYNIITFLIGMVIFALFYIIIISKYLDKFVYSIIVGGALGNFYDRVIYKAVPDFIDLHYNEFHWFVFNVADIFITLGIITMIIYGSIKKN